MSLSRAHEICDLLREHDIRAVTDPHDVDGPTVYVTPPNRRYDVACGFTASWTLYFIAPTASVDDELWATFDDITDVLVNLLDIETVSAIAYDDKPALEFKFSEIL